jgi:hypothetical protein
MFVQRPIQLRCASGLTDQDGSGDQEFPLKSSLNPAEYGDPTSAISEYHIVGELEGLSVEQVTLANSELFNRAFR